MNLCKNIIIPAATVLLLALLLTRCDKIDPPYLEDVYFEPADTSRTVLVEKFTGHLCPNCPEAAAEAHQLKDIYGHNLIIISVHAGFFSRTQSAPYDSDYTTSAGDALDNHFGFQSYPIGLVSRQKPGGQYRMNVAEWSYYVDSLANDPPAAMLDLNISFNASTRQTDITVNGSFLKDLPGDYNLAIVITEDSIISAQKNNNPQLGDTPDIDPYVHLHMLRTAVNGTWGEHLITAPRKDQPIPEKTYSYTLKDQWEESNCMVIAYIYRYDDACGTELEVIQAAQQAIQ